MEPRKMEGQSQKRKVKILEAKGGNAERNSDRPNSCVIHPTSRIGKPIYNDTKLVEQLVTQSNMTIAYKRVVSNKGSPGIDDIPVENLKSYLWENWERIKEEILNGSYQPQPVKRVEIPKPNGGKRMLGIPTVIDRLIQQALHQILSPIFEQTFSDNSYGFRPGRKAQDAIVQAKSYIREGKRWVVDMDLEKFFDKVNHDILIERVRRKVKDKQILRLIRKYLKSGVIENGIAKSNKEGTPQGGPLSP